MFNFIVLENTPEGIKCIREIANHLQGVATALRKQADAMESKTRTETVTHYGHSAVTTNVRKIETK